MFFCAKISVSLENNTKKGPPDPFLSLQQVVVIF